MMYVPKKKVTMMWTLIVKHKNLFLTQSRGGAAPNESDAYTINFLLCDFYTLASKIMKKLLYNIGL